MCDTHSILVKHRNYLLLNKNLLIAGLGAFFISALAAQLYSIYDNNAMMNSIVTLIVEYGVYIPLFAFLFYHDNKCRYAGSVNLHGMTVWNDVKKLLTVFSFSEMIYFAIRGYSHYQILTTGIEAYQASMISALVASGIYFICINLGVKLVRLFKQK